MLCFDVNRQMVRTKDYEGLDESLRMLNHEMGIQTHLGARTTQPCHEISLHGQVGNKVTIHNIQVQQITPGLHHVECPAPTGENQHYMDAATNGVGGASVRARKRCCLEATGTIAHLSWSWLKYRSRSKRYFASSGRIYAADHGTPLQVDGFADLSSRECNGGFQSRTFRIRI